MDIRSQIAMVFHLDKCIGCHTCSIACKNVWTDRKGAEYMWWNNVETKPGTGYPSKWEDQDIYKGGWEKKNESVRLKGAGKGKGLKNLFHNPNMPVLDDYYEPWTYKYETLFNAPEGDDQPVAKPVSLITGEEMNPRSGPNWDDDLGGSKEYARQDVNMKNLSQEEQQMMFQLERMVMFYLPRMCNHCLNPACVAACPSGAIYKRGEDGVVLINQQKCRAWRMCVTACPYKKTYYNWNNGKSEKCILCFPRIETGQAPACMHTCVGRIRYLGVLLYDADKIEEIASCVESQLVEKQRAIYLDPFDPEILKAAKANGIADSTIESAQKSPVYKFVKEWELALPLHPEYRTVPNLFYVPPMLPTMANMEGDIYNTDTESLWGKVEASRLPLNYLANLFSTGDTDALLNVFRKMLAVRLHRRQKQVGDMVADEVEKALKGANMTADMADAIFRLTSIPTFDERFVIPPAHREEALEMAKETSLDQKFTGKVQSEKGKTGFGFNTPPERGW